MRAIANKLPMRDILARAKALRCDTNDDNLSLGWRPLSS